MASARNTFALSPGDHLVTPRWGYLHHGIYAGAGRVIHYAGLSKLLPFGSVEELSLARFARSYGFDSRATKLFVALVHSSARVATGNPTAYLLAKLRDDVSASNPSVRPFFEQAIAQLRDRFVRGDLDNHGVSVQSAPPRGLANWQVRRVTSYMRQRLEEEVALRDLAALVDLSRFHFCTAFRLATGRTPHEWLTHERMARAKTLLADPKRRVTDVAMSVGYGTPSAFAATFRRVVGQTPTQFRRAL